MQSASQVSIASKISGIAAGLGQDRLPLTAVCTNTCPKARDGVCQDGRQVLKASRQQPFPVLCDLGTDCEDCGPWITSASEEQLAWTPVADILDANMTITMRELALPRAFSFAVTDPRIDVDVSAQVMAYGYFEGHTFRIWHDIFMDCGTPGSHFIDVGGNFGYYSVMAAVYGCRVTSWEPVPTFSAYFKYNALLNDVAHRIELREAIVSDEDGKELTITIPNHGILGTAGVDGNNIDTGDVLPLTSCTSASPPVLLQSCSLATPCAAAHWSYGPWSGCDAACGGGEASRNATCVDGPCTEPAALTTECNTGACTAHAWRTGDWQACSVTCGGGGSQSRTVPSSCTSGSVDAAGACCDSGVVSGTGACCPSGASLDASGACCGAGKALDACGVCGGNATAVDALGACCASGQLDAAGLCCASGALDACGVCDGLGTSCDLALSLRMGVNASLVSDGGVEQAPLQAYLDALGRAAGVDGLGQAEDLALSTGGSRRRRRALLQAGGPATVGQGGAQDVGLDQTAEAPSPALAAGSPSTAAGSPSTAAGSPVTAPTPSASGASTPPTVLATLTVPADSRTGNSPWTPGWFAATLVPGAVSDEAVQLLAPAVASSVAVCGNGVCELGEVGQAGSGVTGTCPADCPLATPAGCSGGCGAGTCQAAAGTCLCWQGYAGERCATCAAGYAVGAAGACSADVVALGLLRSQSQSSPGQVPHPAPAPAPAPGPAPGPGPGAVAWAPPPPPANGTVEDASVASGGPPLGAILGPVLVALAIAAAVSTLLCVRRRRRALSRAGSPFTPAPSSGGGPDLEKGGGGEPREVSLREKYGSPTGGRGGTDPGRIAAVHILCDSDDSPGGAATGGRYDAQASPLGPAGRKVALGGAALLARSAGLEPRGAREVGGVWRRVGSDPGVEGCAMSGTGLGQLCMGMHRRSPPLGPPRHRQGRAVKRVASAAGDPSLRRRATPLDPSFSTRKAPRFNAALYQCESSGGDVPGLSGGVSGAAWSLDSRTPARAGEAARRAPTASSGSSGAPGSAPRCAPSAPSPAETRGSAPHAWGDAGPEASCVSASALAGASLAVCPGTEGGRGTGSVARGPDTATSAERSAARAAEARQDAELDHYRMAMRATYTGPPIDPQARLFYNPAFATAATPSIAAPGGVQGQEVRGSSPARALGSAPAPHPKPAHPTAQEGGSVAGRGAADAAPNPIEAGLAVRRARLAALHAHGAGAESVDEAAG
ncbi:A disintegrin and metalloproteinase with thrombospondin motifs 12 [Auxenochlorella protothecoides]|uniref:A disintegrin and metalloproteinase with thrombospondin motifs 12 n=1 Tax=Auxenochlorella protothecoides TaxID=3075 RepID=A0A087SGL0_AUXPR|nr:A disintegrin and metalloproteinase with thrombospondin motifs 12 [Auxenochlorella protothecoides]KFM24864.1 A disintegrin and metalloproteinase with thrombospondin motifs 12 [Auxenochlorella protothecoides]